ncbi:D-xylose ABC transporter ATP-binding protein [candidate division KSB3 bacterium]|uniref:D-xylose ABC transporter ATP-binding protein n=1 Tax=candidate division KSB3 bacterium TaxID=2044937 RepID=A0A2G6KGJ5_9BACT|nr:MAG: D-xylose ABC transporter ATP-binding protein [candidate division KSB3 bacterium]
MPLLRVQGIGKSYPGVRALDKVDLDVRRGEVHCLAGENGAGKSTLIEIIGGTHKKDEGSILLNGEEIDFTSPKHAQEQGIAVLHQELPVLPYLSVAENIFLARQPRTQFGMVNYAEMNRQAKHWLDIIGADVNPKTLLGKLPLAKQQLVSIAKALSLEAQIIILDEPSAILTNIELQRLFEIIHSLKTEGRGIVYISHRLEEIFEIGDRVTVLRNGTLVDTKPIGETSKEALIKMMVGREVLEETEAAHHDTGTIGKSILSVKGITRHGLLHNISFDVYQGEILGIFGLVGSGRTELARAIIGADPIDSGEIFIEQTKVDIRSPKHAIEQGLCLAPEDRKHQGLFLGKSVQENIVLPNLKTLRNGFILNYKSIMSYATGFVKKLNIATPTITQKVKLLSGGNQQKVVLAKWLGIQSKVFIFDEPTRGIDVGAKEEIRALIEMLAREGKAVVMISSELPEIMSMSDRILVMHEGGMIQELSRKDATKEKLLAYSMGVTSS